MITPRFYYNISLTGFFGLIFSIIIWNGWLTPVQEISRYIEITLLLLPLLLFALAIIRGNITAHVYISLPTLLYFLLGIWYSINSEEALYGYLLTLFSMMLFFGSFFYAKLIIKLQNEHDIQKKGKQHD